MAILVTGGAGYIGSVTVDQLREGDENVVELSASSSGRSQSSTPPFSSISGSGWSAEEKSLRLSVTNFTMLPDRVTHSAR